jgi:hypothetical protein
MPFQGPGYDTEKIGPICKAVFGRKTFFSRLAAVGLTIVETGFDLSGSREEEKSCLNMEGERPLWRGKISFYYSRLDVLLR